MTDLPIIDHERLHRVCDGDEELAGQLIDAVIEELDPMVARFDGLLALGDRLALGEIAHHVKGTAGNVGAERLQAAALVLEQGLKSGADVAALTRGTSGVAAAMTELRAERTA